MTRRISVVTGTRADYGLLRWLLSDLRDREDVELSLVVTGMHLSADFGETWRIIEQDGFTIDERVDMLEDDDTRRSIARSTAAGLMGITDSLGRLAPDLVVLLGDRFEIFAAAQACLFLGIPVAHIAGGELTEGAFDDALRHAITKMSHLHFPSAGEYAARIARLGEQPSRIFPVGAIGLDNFERLNLLSPEQLETELSFPLGHPLALCTFHPETLNTQTIADAVAPLFAALERLPELRVVFTKGNADTGGRELNDLVDRFVAGHRDRMIVYTSLGQLRYLSLMRAADVVLGNSSSGILEAPTAGTPTVNIGDRQRGRLRAPSVIDVPATSDGIIEGVLRALSPQFQHLASRRVSPFGRPGASQEIARIIATQSLDGILIKAFHDSEGIA